MSGLVTPTETKGAFCPGWSHQPGQKGHPLVRVGVTNRNKRVGPFITDGATNRDKRPLPPPLARLAVGPGTKAIFCPGPKGSRDKWLGTKACSVVVKKPQKTSSVASAPAPHKEPSVRSPPKQALRLDEGIKIFQLRATPTRRCL